MEYLDDWGSHWFFQVSKMVSRYIIVAEYRLEHFIICCKINDIYLLSYLSYNSVYYVL